MSRLLTKPKKMQVHSIASDDYDDMIKQVNDYCLGHYVKHIHFYPKEEYHEFMTDFRYKAIVLELI